MPADLASFFIAIAFAVAVILAVDGHTQDSKQKEREKGK